MTLFPALTPLTAAVVPRTVASSAILTLPPIAELAAPSTDGVVTPLLTVGLAAKVDVMAQLVVLGATPERPLQLQRRLEPKNPCWARLRVRLRMALILLMAHVALEMATPSVVIGQTVLVVLFTG